MPGTNLRFRLPPVAALFAACAAALAAESESGAPVDFATGKRDFEERIASYAKIDTHAPRTLRERYEYGRFLEENADEDCLLRLEAAQQQIESVLAADERSALITTEMPGLATHVLTRIHLKRAGCLEDEQATRAALQQGLDAARRAVGLFAAVYDYDSMAVAQYNVAYALHELGEKEQAIAALQQAMALDERYGLRSDQVDNYRVLYGWQHDGAELDDKAIETYTAGLKTKKARLTFSDKPYQAEQTHAQEVIRFQNASRSTTNLSMNARVSMQREGEGLLLSSKVNGTPTYTIEPQPAQDDVRGKIQSVVTRLDASNPDVLVTRQGEFQAVRNFDVFHAALMGQIELALGDVSKDMDAKQREQLQQARKTLIDTMLSKPALESLLRDEWALEVSAWLDAELDHGDWYEAEFEGPLAGLEDLSVKNKFAFKVASWLKCDEQDPGESCVEILVRTTPDPDSLSAALTGLVERAAPQARGQFEIRDYESVSLQRLVTEPGTLRMHSRDVLNLMYIAVDSNGARSTRTERQHRVTATKYLQPT